MSGRHHHESTAAPVDKQAGTGESSGRTALLSLAPWTRAAFLAWRQPAVVLAVLAATAILACASASASLFVSSAASRTLQLGLAAQCPTAGYPSAQVRARSQNTKLAAAALDVAARMRAEGLAKPRLLANFNSSYPASLGQQSTLMRPVYGDGAIKNLTVISKVDGDGAYLPEFAATYLKAKPGDTVTFLGQPIKVVGVYKNLYDEPVRPYWCVDRQLYLNEASLNTPPPAMMILTNRADFFALTVLPETAPAEASLTSTVSSSSASLNQAQGWQDRVDAAVASSTYGEDSDIIISPDGTLGPIIQDTQLIRNGLLGPVVPIAVGGSLLALLLVGAAGSYWADRRFNEVRLLASRGIGPGGLAMKAALELAAPAVLGTALGWLAAQLLVKVVGPSPVLDANAPVFAGLTAVGGLVAGLAVMALVAGLRSRGHVEKSLGRKRSKLSMIPFELVLIIASGVAWWYLKTNGAVVTERRIAQLNILVVAFPLMFLLGSTALVIRLVVAALPLLRRKSSRAGNGLFLAVSRVSSSKLISGVVLAALAVPMAMTLYAAGLTDSSRHTIDAKAGVFVGSNVSVATITPLNPDSAAAKLGTVVRRYEYVTINGQEAELLTIDPATFTKYAYWDSSFSDQPLEQIVAELAKKRTDGKVPVAIMDGPADASQLALGSAQDTRDLVVVDRPSTFPGRHLPVPLVIAAASAIPDIPKLAGRVNELWTHASRDEALKLVSAEGVRITNDFTPSKVFSVANLLAVSWTFGYLQALAALAGAVAIGGLLLYVETRQRSRVASYAMARRMGLSRRTHLRSLLIEFGSLVGFAALVGAGLAWIATVSIYWMIELSPSRVPGPILVTPVPALIGVAVVAIVVALLTAIYAQRAADRVKMSEVLRLGD